MSGRDFSLSFGEIAIYGTSGRDWNRTRRMGVNTLAFRGVQHGAFFATDADCVGIMAAVPW
ncbi:MAG: hypothetical protein DMG58_10690 [Acidobacteria bacterium]|nr:MAG: hypothetical protein DMG58_10690 [Acidobacteriota bacterium]PYV78470.1 MAG: hypothetical protein DMG96_07715 [Acidobacteriota bacterium]